MDLSFARFHHHYHLWRQKRSHHDHREVTLTSGRRFARRPLREQGSEVLKRQLLWRLFLYWPSHRRHYYVAQENRLSLEIHMSSDSLLFAFSHLGVSREVHYQWSPSADRQAQPLPRLPDLTIR